MTTFPTTPPASTPTGPSDGTVVDRDPSGDASATPLRIVLRVNAATSMLAAAVMAAVPGRVDDLLDTGHPGWIRLVGLGLALFALDVALLSTRSAGALRRFTPWVEAADVGWVLGSGATILAGWYSAGGAVAVAAVATVVGAFAVLQLRHRRRLGPPPATRGV